MSTRMSTTPTEELTDRFPRSKPVARLLDHRWARVVILVVSTLLLLSMGGAIVAAPVSVPALWVIARRHSGPARGWAVMIVALTVAEVVWAAVYVLVGETAPWIWLVPLIGGALVLASLVRPRP